MRILIADDDTLLRAGLKYLLKDLDGQLEFFEASSYGQALDVRVDGAGFDLVLVDLALAGLEGPAGLQNLCQEFKPAPVVVISMKDSAEEVLRAFEAGVRGYIPKSSDPNVMIHALRLVLSGGNYLPSNILRGAERRAEPLWPHTDDMVTKLEVSAPLTHRQLEVLSLLVRGKTNKEIARRLDIVEGTVKLHVSRILRALGVHNRAQAAIAASRLLSESPRLNGLISADFGTRDEPQESSLPGVS